MKENFCSAVEHGLTLRRILCSSMKEHSTADSKDLAFEPLMRETHTSSFIPHW